MSTHADRIHRVFRFMAAVICLLAFAACEDDQAPAPQPAGINLVSGDAQYTRKGTQLEDAVVVRVSLEDGAAASGAQVSFQVVEGGGSLSRTAATTGTDGRTSVRWTVGPDTGLNRLRISVAGNSNLSTIATATSSEYYCIEEDPTFSQKFFSTGNLMMLTGESVHTAGTAGLVRYTIDPSPPPQFSGQSVANYPEGVFEHVIRDLVFGVNGDLFISWNFTEDEIVKVAADGSVSHFATLDSEFGAELALTPNGVLVGCDVKGPFYVTCRDSLFRFEDALFSGDVPSRDAANSDAVACDPTNGDVYFIYKQDRRLYRIPFDGTTASTKVDVAVLPIEESDGARGMVVDAFDRALYILVDYEGANTVKSILKVTTDGTRTTLYDFFDRGAGSLAGTQNDLAINRQFRYLYTLDTENNVFLLYGLAAGQQQLITYTSSGNEYSASNTSVGERVGLDVIPGP